MRGLAEMLTMPERSFRCGPLALQRILSIAKSPPSPDSLMALEDSRSTPNGLSLTSVQAASVRAGVNFRMAFRAPGAQIVTPAVVHWKGGHYAAGLGKNADRRYQVEDATFGPALRITPDTLAPPPSGYFP